jgi:hypothetical protein
MATDPESGFTEAEDAAMRKLYREMGEREMPGDEPFDAEAGLRDLKERLAGPDPGCPAVMPGPPPADGAYRCELGAGHYAEHCFAGSRWSDAGTRYRPAAVTTDPQPSEIQVIMTPGIQPAFKSWLASRGLYLFPIPTEENDPLPTYGIGIR